MAEILGGYVQPGYTLQQEWCSPPPAGAAAGVGSNVLSHLRSHEVGCRCGEAEQRERAE